MAHCLPYLITHERDDPLPSSSDLGLGQTVRGEAPASDDLGLGKTVREFVAGQILFGRYKLKRFLGRGGMGVVWLAHDEQLERDVAIKFLPDMVAADPEAIADLKRETRRSLELTHPHIVRIHDLVQDGTCACISMEYVDGKTLSALKVEQPGLCFSVETVTPWVRQLLEALDYAHTRARVVHRDLKPANLMINGVGELKVADFGIAKSLSDSVSRMTLRVGTSGTLVYMSPQQAQGRTPVASDDIYSLGATLYDLLSASRRFIPATSSTSWRRLSPMRSRRGARSWAHGHGHPGPLGENHRGLFGEGTATPSRLRARSGEATGHPHRRRGGNRASW